MSIVSTEYICLVFKFTCFVRSRLPSICFQIMSATSFQDLFGREGFVKAGDSNAIVTALSRVNVVVTKEQVHDALEAMGLNDDDSLSVGVMGGLCRFLTPDVADDATLADTMECSGPQPRSAAEAPADQCRFLLNVSVTDLQSALSGHLRMHMG